ncbi:MAG: hypothetical protein HWN66_07680, partial [Candidatus Helarchaeota archaeon]|nr:hypothetical protein [Candidatus Helarchaeota archaeon]
MLENWLGFCALILSGIAGLIICYKVFIRIVRGNRSKLYKFYSLGSVSFGCTLLVLAVNRLFLFAYPHPTLGIGTAVITNFFSFFAFLFLTLFTFYATFPQHAKKLTPMLITVVIILGVGLMLSIGGITIQGTEIAYPIQFKLVMLCAGGPLMVLGIGMWSYYSHIMKTKSLPHSRRAAGLAVMALLMTVAFVPETLGFAAIINYLRFTYIPIIILFYICFLRFAELEWPQKVHHLYLIHQDNGIALYDHTFIAGGRPDRNLVAGGITGVAALLQELTTS